MEELAIRFAIDAEALGTSSLEKLASDAQRWGNWKMAEWIDVLLKVAGVGFAFEAKSLLDKQALEPIFGRVLRCLRSIAIRS